MQRTKLGGQIILVAVLVAAIVVRFLASGQWFHPSVL